MKRVATLFPVVLVLAASCSSADQPAGQSSASGPPSPTTSSTSRAATNDAGCGGPIIPGTDVSGSCTATSSTPASTNSGNNEPAGDPSDLCTILTPARVASIVKGFDPDPYSTTAGSPQKSCKYSDRNGAKDSTLGASANLAVIDPAEVQRRGGPAKTLAFYERYLGGPKVPGAVVTTRAVDLGDGGTEYVSRVASKSTIGYTFLWRNGQRVVLFDVSAASKRMADRGRVEDLADGLNRAFD